jgi:hypothetical protein
MQRSQTQPSPQHIFPRAFPNLFDLCKATSGMLIHSFSKASGAYRRAAHIGPMIHTIQRMCGKTSRQGRVDLSIPISLFALLSYIYSHSNVSADNWRLRYKFISLYGPVWTNHLAYFPPNLRLLLRLFLYLLTKHANSVAHLHTLQQTRRPVRDLRRPRADVCARLRSSQPRPISTKRAHHRSQERVKVQVRCRTHRAGYGSWG